MSKEINEQQIATKVSFVTIVANIILSLLKFLAGLIGHSAAMLSDAVHSLSDVFSTVVVFIGVKVSAKESDANHQYGHERIECVTAIILSVFLALTGVFIGYDGIQKIFSGNIEDIPTPGLIALVIAIVSIIVKEAMYHYTVSAAKKINSSAMKADAWHHRSDALSSIGSFIGIAGARLGFPIMDPIACVIICLFIIKVAFDIFRDTIYKMTDRACDEKTANEIRDVILKQDGVIAIDMLKTRLFGNKIYVDVEISADRNLRLYEAHMIAENVHAAIEKEIDNVKHCMVHVNPA